ncbi:conserved hypothetical protein [Paraburkholderia caribensis]|uniref:DUF6471 domain-containing protein n=1 Tax=Paraburkholderia caribensis TaxID=75105 RepID=UPI001CB5028C|nr:DUF6471 domain-containing protein [Paraburkholderia caribensis]CAG9236618.1 conserved hypothetical protein [Paraburkholderia caribensis]
MSKDDQYMIGARNILRGVMVTKGISFDRLSELLSTDGAREAPRSIAAKVNRGKFTFAFFLRCMSVLGMDGGFFLIPTREEMLAMETTGTMARPEGRLKKVDTRKPPAKPQPAKPSSVRRKKEADVTTG